MSQILADLKQIKDEFKWLYEMRWGSKRLCIRGLKNDQFFCPITAVAFMKLQTRIPLMQAVKVASELNYNEQESIDIVKAADDTCETEQQYNLRHQLEQVLHLGV